jgi:cation-transporting P-type ATPase E
VTAPELARTSTDGLTAAEVAQRVAAGQTNDVPSRASRSLTDIVRANVFTRFNAIIGALFVIILIIGPIQDGLFGYVIIVNTLIGIVQEWRAKHTLEQLAIVGAAHPRIRRDGSVGEYAANEIVLDDVIELGPGEEIVVDGEVIAADGLEVDESLLTGESDPVVKHPSDSLLSGSFVAAGSGSFRVTKVGRDSYAARLAEEASKFTLVNSQLRAGIDRILRIVTWLLFPAGALVIYSQLHGNKSTTGALRGMVAALVPMVPEGLILLTSVAFAVGVIRLGGRKCLVQELPAIETLARVDTVCADKTGTLTENGMRLAEVKPLSAGDRVGETLAALAAADPSPNASMQAIDEAYSDNPQWTVTATMAFSSARKWSGASFAEHGNWVLGAPDVLLPADSAALVEAERLGTQGLRVLLLGRGTDRVDAPTAPGSVSAVALVVLEQRIRPDASPTLRYFAEQGIAVKVISGDNATSVGAVAATLELPGAEKPLDARQLSEDRAELGEELAGTTVFGRVTPAQKRAMVGALQSTGHTVAMTGDGVNDVLALKDADVGVAMGSGSPATRAVAQIVLLDNKFATLPYVVAEGRRVIGNIERVAALFLTKTVYSVFLAILIGALGLPYPFLPRHLTLIGALTIGIPSFFLALAPNRERARSGFVERVLRRAAPAGVVAGAATLVTYLLVRNDPGATAARSGTAALITLFVIAMWVLVVAARPYEPWKIGLIAAMTLAFPLALFVPFARHFFALSISDPHGMLVGLACGAVGMVLVEIAWRIGTRWSSAVRG